MLSVRSPRRAAPVLLAALLLAALLPACAGAPGGSPATMASPAMTVAALPAQMAGFRSTGRIVDFEGAPGGAGLGASHTYAPVSGERIIATVYVYDRGARRAPEGGGSPDVADELRRTYAEAQALTRTGRYRSVAFDTGMDMGGRNAPPEMRCLNFRVVQGDGQRTGDSVCVSVGNGAFVKTRVTSWQPPEPVFAGLAAMALLTNALGARAPGT